MVNRAAIGEKILTEYFLSKKESYIRIDATTDTEVNTALQGFRAGQAQTAGHHRKSVSESWYPLSVFLFDRNVLSKYTAQSQNVNASCWIWQWKQLLRSRGYFCVDDGFAEK